ncbi:hypothetical protein A8H35_12715 [Burkholderia thailandensis]|nr:hypothetical protein A8H35_12715 [Burkholderia thailandensis]
MSAAMCGRHEARERGERGGSRRTVRHHLVERFAVGAAAFFASACDGALGRGDRRAQPPDRCARNGYRVAARPAAARIRLSAARFAAGSSTSDVERECARCG